MTTDDGVSGLSPAEERDIAAFVLGASGFDCAGVRRFTTGLCHRVYLVADGNGGECVLRLSDPGVMEYHYGSLHWLPRLAGIGVPVPAVLSHGQRDGVGYVLLERLPGRDLGRVYGNLDDGEKRRVAMAVADVQRGAAGLDSPGGFGFTFGDRPGRYGSWEECIRGQVERDRGTVARHGVFSPDLADAIMERLPGFAGYFSGIRPVPFLDDTTTKNVLVADGRLSGIVDVDEVCLGDGLLTVGLTRMALLNVGAETSYVGYWLDALGTDEAGRRAVSLYTLLFCFGFMGELGMRCENGTMIPAASRDVGRLRGLFSRLLDEV